MISINLLPDTRKHNLKAAQLKATVISISTLVIIIAVAIPLFAFFIDLGIKARSNQLTDSIRSNQAKITSAEDLSRILTVQSQISSVDQIDQNRLRADNIIEIIDAVTPGGVSINQFTASSGGEMSISFEARTLGEAEAFIESLFAVQVSDTSNDSSPVTITPVTSVAVSSYSYNRQKKTYNTVVSVASNTQLWTLQDMTDIKLDPFRLKYADDLNVDLKTNPKLKFEQDSSNESTSQDNESTNTTKDQQ